MQPLARRARVAIVGMADVEARAALAGDDVGRAGLCLDAADRGDEARRVRASLLDAADPLGRAGQRVAARTPSASCPA